jgi:hypothetical protein
MDDFILIAQFLLGKAKSRNLRRPLSNLLALKAGALNFKIKIFY